MAEYELISKNAELFTSSLLIDSVAELGQETFQFEPNVPPFFPSYYFSRIGLRPYKRYAIALSIQDVRTLEEECYPESAATALAKDRYIDTQRQESVIQLLNSWLVGDENEQRETWDFLKRALDENRLSSRKLFE